MNHCKNCGFSFEGRSNQDFCCDKCRYSYNNAKAREDRAGMNKILKTLLKNREILKMLYENGQTQCTKQTLNDNGYNSSFMTHQVQFELGSIGIFCFEYGFKKKQNNLEIIYANE